MKSIEFDTNTMTINNLKELNSKLPNEMTQDDLFSLQEELNTGLFYDYDNRLDKDYDTIFAALRRTLDSKNFCPMDNRSFPEFALDVLLEWIIDVQNNVVITRDTAYDVMDIYFADRTMTYNTNRSLNYIRSFWDDFIEEDMEDFDVHTVFARPELFLVHQTHRMMNHVIDAILDDAGVAEMNSDEFVRYIDEEGIRGYRLSELVY